MELNRMARCLTYNKNGRARWPHPEPGRESGVGTTTNSRAASAGDKGEGQVDGSTSAVFGSR
ncbi:MAG: DUF3944 domain-containing protein [Bradyrhizobiaceae bacterium]|nr:MAG: DUF3944 domain-containing protein [Bradyrhizobiaceae bacterium]